MATMRIVTMATPAWYWSVADEKMSMTVMAKELAAKAPEYFGKYLAKKPKSGRIFAENGKASFKKLIQKHAPNLRMTVAGSAQYVYVKKRQ